jgi:Domain of Unknown Function (DUF1080)
MRIAPVLFACLCLVAAALPQTLPNLYSSEAHGDPPFLREKGWQPLLNGKDLGGWRPETGSTSEWFTTRSVHWKRVFAPTSLTASPEPGDRIVNGKGKTSNFVSVPKFGDVELFLEFMLAKGSNSGVYLQSLYELQIFDSFGYTGHLTVGDCGGIYGRNGSEGGSPPMRNACREPGEWQSLHVWFRAPRFDREGKKIENARFLRVLLNDVLVQQDFEVLAPTQSSVKIPEAAENPLMLQGDHGPVAYRNIYVRPLRGK